MPNVSNTGFRENPADEAWTVKGRFRCMPTPYIGITQALIGFLNEQSKLGIGVQEVLRNIINKRIFQYGNVRAIEHSIDITMGGHI